ncbi:MAG: Maf family protein [Myxococcota bacterium]
MFPSPALVLASGSPRRAALLRQAGVTLTVSPVPCDETSHPAEPALEYARRIAADKRAAALAALRDTLAPGQLVLTADTVVWVGDEEPTPLGKPTTPEGCARMLAAIAGPRGHRVTTAWTLGPADATVDVHDVTTRVWMRTLHDDERDAYLATDAWRDKAGGYGIQAEAAGWVTRIEGSYTNVVGLPVAEVVQALRAGR